MRKQSKGNRRKLVAEINVVPYIDVMLVLLVIFMVTAPLLQQGVSVDLPDAAATALPEKDKSPIVVSVDDEGSYYLNVSGNPAAPMDPRALKLQVAAELVRDPKRQVLVKGDKNVAYGQVVGAMVLLQQAGAPTVGLVTQGNELEAANAGRSKRS
ncbi:MAG: protein TolR [Gammaproteobacteria bacterium]